MEDQIQKCINCHKSYPIDRIDLHEAYCCRNIKKCQKCQKMVDVNDQQQHEKQFHPNTQSDIPNPFVSSSLLDKYQKKYLNHTKPQFKNMIPQKQFQKHFKSAEIAIRPCLTCQQMVRITDWNQQQSCITRRQQKLQKYQPRRQATNERGTLLRNDITDNGLDQITHKFIPEIISSNLLKPSNIIEPQVITGNMDPLPISIKISIINKKKQELTLKNKD